MHVLLCLEFPGMIKLLLPRVVICFIIHSFIGFLPSPTSLPHSFMGISYNLLLNKLLTLDSLSQTLIWGQSKWKHFPWGCLLCELFLLPNSESKRDPTSFSIVPFFQFCETISSFLHPYTVYPLCLLTVIIYWHPVHYPRSMEDSSTPLKLSSHH